MLLVIAVIVRRNRSGHSPQRNETEARLQEATSAPNGSASQPFDGGTATPVQESVVVSGPARIVDGDTLVIRKTQIRLFGVDAPELDHPYGKKAKWALVSLCKGQKVRAEITELDDYGRTVAKCYLEDGTDLSAEMVKQGLALDWPKFSDGKYRTLETSDARKKLWLADARQKGRMHVWEKFEATRDSRRKDS